MILWANFRIEGRPAV